MTLHYYHHITAVKELTDVSSVNEHLAKGWIILKTFEKTVSIESEQGVLTNTQHYFLVGWRKGDR